VVINGGTVHASSGGKSGIGGGYNSGTSVNINGGSVTASGVAGIGGANIAITKGNIIAEGSSAGIAGYNVIISGGIVSSICDNQPGIDSHSVAISGGTIFAQNKNINLSNRRGIGKGYNELMPEGFIIITGGSVYMDPVKPFNDSQILPKNEPDEFSEEIGTVEKGQKLYFTKVQLEDAVEGEKVSSLAITYNGAPYSYGTNDMFVDEFGCIYLFLPKDAEVTAVTTDMAAYHAETTDNKTDESNEKAVIFKRSSEAGSTGFADGDEIQSPAGTESFALAAEASDYSSLPSTTNRIVVDGSTASGTFNITLDGVSIDASPENQCAMELKNGAQVNLLLEGSNKLYSGYNFAGLQVPSGSSVTIKGREGGSLEAKAIGSNTYVAGIGGNASMDAGEIIIESGKITAIGYYGAGIGGGGTTTGCGGKSGNITIKGGIVIAESAYGAAIGSGGSKEDIPGEVEEIRITGGTVMASTAASGRPIGTGAGSGQEALTGGSLIISGGTVIASSNNGFELIQVAALTNEGNVPVYLTRVQLEGVDSATKISSLSATYNGSAYSYGVTDMYTDDNGILYLYLPEGAKVTGATAQTKRYIGSVITTTDKNTSTGILKLSAAGGSSSTGSSGTTKSATSPGGVAVTMSISGNSTSIKLDSSIKDILAGGKDEPIPVNPGPGVDSYQLEIPVSYLAAAGSGSLMLEMNIGSVTIPAGMLANIEGSEAQISISRIDASSLPAGVQAIIGNRPVIRINLAVDGKQTAWNNPAAPVTVSIPYTPTAEELAHPECIIIWYIDGSGNLICVPDGHYDTATGTVTFSTSHFSDYAVGFNIVQFKDVPEDAWYYKAVSFIAARGITNGTGNGNFSPEASLKRADFLVLLLRTYGIEPEAKPTANFADAGNTYYTGYLAKARTLGMASGVGNNLFAPEQPITRQEMFALLYKTLKAINRLPAAETGKTLAAYADSGDIAKWAKDVTAQLVEAGIINSSDGRLLPREKATRADMAQILYNLLNK